MLEVKYMELYGGNKIKKNYVRSKEGLSFLGIKGDPLVKKMTNLLMQDGKRSKAEDVIYKVLKALDEKYPGRALHIFYFGVFEARRDIGIRLKPKPKKRRRVSAFNVYLPYTIEPIKGLNLGMRALLKAGRESPASRPFWSNLSQEIFLASLGKGEVVAKRYNLNKLADSNKRRVHLGSRCLFPLIPEFQV